MHVKDNLIRNREQFNVFDVTCDSFGEVERLYPAEEKFGHIHMIEQSSEQHFRI